MRNMKFVLKKHFHERKTFQNIPKIVSIKAFTTYGEYETYTFLKNTHHEQATRNSLVPSWSKNTRT